MHEVSLVQGLMEQVRDIVEENGSSRVTRILVRIGPFAGVVIESFVFAFDALKTGDRLFSRGRLEIDSPEPEFVCRSCARRFEGMNVGSGVQGHGFYSGFSWGTCPSCGKDSLYPAGGDEILLMQVEME